MFCIFVGSFFIHMNMAEKRTTPEYITQLAENEIFVFGSNLEGSHGGGAALLAWRKFGAIWGQGVGLQGQSYGIPTMQGGVETIRPYVDEFIAFAKQHPELTFLVTRIGCGIAGFTNEEDLPSLQGCSWHRQHRVAARVVKNSFPRNIWEVQKKFLSLQKEELF